MCRDGVGLVGKDNNARTEHLCIYQLQNPLLAPVSEETLSAPQDNGVNHEPVLVDEVMLHQRADKVSTASDQDILARLLLEPGVFFYSICQGEYMGIWRNSP